MRLASCYLLVYRLMSSTSSYMRKAMSLTTLVLLLGLMAGCAGGSESDVDGHLLALKPDTYETIMAASKCETLSKRHDSSASIVRRNIALAPEIGARVLPLLLDNLALRLAEVDATEVRMRDLACDASLLPQAPELKQATCEALDARYQQAADSLNEEAVEAVADTIYALGC